MSGVGTGQPVQKYGQRVFPVPRKPHIRIWGLKKLYPEPLWVSGYDDPGKCFTVAPGTPSKFPFKTDEKDADAWTTANITDFVFTGKGTTKAPVEAWIYLSLGSSESPKFAVYVHDDGDEVRTIFGTITRTKEKPEPFRDGGENYFCEMSDGQGLWLWLYRLYGPVS